MRLETYQSVCCSNGQATLDRVILQYDESQNWVLRLYGEPFFEVWAGNPGSLQEKFFVYNNVMFGNSLFDEDQMKFHNISKNKDMLDILDVNEVDGCYYGLFKGDGDSYVVFRSATKYIDDNGVSRSGVVQRLPYDIAVPKMFRTADDIYSLYVVSRENGRQVLREISVPDDEIYTHRTIDIDGILDAGTTLPDGSSSSDGGLTISTLIMEKFAPGKAGTSFFCLSNRGFHKIPHVHVFRQLSIDRMEGVVDGNPVGLKDILYDELRKVVLGQHLESHHEGNTYFATLSRKAVQTSDDFNVFDLLPAEFR